MNEANTSVAPAGGTTPALWPLLYDRIFVHWRTTLAGLAGAAFVVVPVLQANGFGGKAVTLCGALALAIITTLSKDK